MPDGNTAALEEMVAASKAVKAYNAEMDAYLGCIKLEQDGSLNKPGSTLSEEQKGQIAAMFAQKNNAAIDELTAVAARLNEQIRVYKAKHPSK